MKVEITFEELKFLVDNKKPVKVESRFNCYDEVIDCYEKFGEGYKIFYNDATFNICASLHRILISTDNGNIYKNAIDLKIGDITLDANLQESKIITKIEKVPEQRWIDFSIDNESESYIQNGIVHHNSGKSATIFYLIQFLRASNKKIILIVPSVSLVNQMYSDFKEYGWNDINEFVSILYSGETPDFDKSLLITTWQSIYNRTQDFFEKYEAVIIDETHLAKSLSINSIMKKCINADYRIGLTGTLPTEKSDIYNIFGYLGPILYQQYSHDLIDKGILSQIKIANILLKYPNDIVERNRNRPYNEEIYTIFNYDKRNEIFKFLFKNIPEGQNSLILCHQIEHLKTIEKYLINILDDRYTIYIIYGEIKPEEREYIRKMMNEKSNVILIGTFSTLSTGINIKRIHNVIFASSYKSKIKILQSIGRGLRLHESKDKMILYDLVDDLSWETRNGSIGKNHVFKHWEERLKYYDEQGFVYFNKSYKLQ